MLLHALPFVAAGVVALVALAPVVVMLIARRRR